MYKVLDGIADEVALEGDQGCSVDKLFTLVETLITKDIKDTHLNQPLLFDDDYKAYAWQQIKGNSHLLFSERGNPINASNLTYDGLKSMDMSVSAVEEVLDRNIYGSLKHEKKSLTDKQRLLLNSIAKSRSQGISQHELGEMFDMDSKAVFYHLKRLDQLGLIVKENAYVSRMCTKLLFLKRFASIPGTKTDDDQKDDGVIYRIPVFKDNIRGLLEKAIDNIMPVADLIDALGLDISAEKKWARVRIQEMHEQGEIEKFNASDGRKTRQCVRLVTSAPTLTTQSHHLQNATQTVRHYSIARDLPSDYIFFKDIEAAGGKGLLRQDLIDKYPLIDPVQFNIFFESATLPSKNPDFDKFILHRTEEFVGRSRQFRYYTTDGWRAFSGLSTTAIPEPTAVITRPEKTEVLEEPKFIDEIARIMNQPSQKRQRYDRDKYLARKEAAKKQKVTVEIADKESTQVPSKRPNSDTTDKSTGFSTLKKVKKDTLRNNTKTRRYGIIIDMVERIQIREFNQEMMNEFKRIELDTPGGQNIARRTFDDLVKELHNQRKLKIYVTAIKKASGLTEIKKFVLHPSLSGDSPQVTEFIDNYSVQKPIMNGISKRKQVKIVNMPALPQSSLTDTQTLAKPLVENTNSWRISAIENGWISSKWLRAKELHEALFKYLETKGISHGIVDMTDFLKLFSLRTLMRIYGLMPYDDPNLVEFLQANENEDMSICDLPADIKAIISQEAPRIRIRIIHLLKILHALSLVSFEEENAIDGYRIPPKIRLLTQGIIRDYAAKEHPIRDTMQLNNIDDVQQYWRDLQTCCLRRRLKADTIHDENDVLYNIVLIRLWKTNTLLTTTQKSILDSFVDFEAKTVPSDEDKSLRNYIAKRSDLSTKRIQAYYNSILMAFKKYEAQNEKQSRRLQKTHSMAASPAITKLMQASMEKRSIDAAMFELKQHEPFIESTFVASRKLRRLRLPVEQYKSIKKTPATKPYRNPLSDVEKDVLLHAYSIMKARSENSFFFWSPISKVIPAYTPEKCRRTLHYMTVLDPTITDTIKKLKSEWLEIYHEGISKKELKDESPWDTQEYDLPAFLEYFVLKLQERESQAKQIEPLPKNLSEFHSKFIIVRDEADKNHVSHCYHEAMYDIPFDSIIDYDEQKVSVHLVMVLIKMILITPDKVYDSKDGYMLLRKFPDEIIEQAVEILTAEGLLVRGKADYGRIPGRRINVSEKFLIMASGVLPFEFFKEARHFYERMTTNLSINFQSSDVNGGSVATILDLTSQRKVSMGVQNLENYTKLRRSVYYPRASAMSMRAAFIYKGLDLRITSNDNTISGYKPEKHIEHIGKSSLLNQEEIGSYLTALYAKHPFSEALYDIIASFGKTGASTSDIRYVISCRYKDKAHLFSETLVVLENHKPPLVQMVGFDQLRYVASEFIASWFINQSNSQYIAPLMWYDTTGAIIPIALEGCANATMSHILQNPGITFANLRDKLRGLFTEYELYYILKYLVESERIIARKLQRKVWPKRLSIFDKRPIASISTSQTLNNDEITCYWLAPGFYV
ncbi:hypothetical protein [Parasitella parasitica]|uniref:Uncharacterized protein n=1 Tax=Parasitella parasitica TaxID=35722 RepID=A0A0B7NMP0_9FUNG|nr:hypothetical protein [Parasitella parasitica]